MRTNIWKDVTSFTISGKFKITANELKGAFEEALEMAEDVTDLQDITIQKMVGEVVILEAIDRFQEFLTHVNQNPVLHADCETLNMSRVASHFNEARLMGADMEYWFEVPYSLIVKRSINEHIKKSYE